VRALRILVGVLASLSLLAGVAAVDARRAHDGAAMTITAVQQPDGGGSFGGASYEPGTRNSTVFALLIGSDERAGLDGARGDALHVVGLNPSLGRATLLNIPRDTWVDIPGHGQGRINTAYQFGGAQLQAETVRRLTGAPISIVITTTFDGLTRMVDGMGGVEVDVPYPMDDQNSGAVFAQGRQRLNGAQALAFSRNRHIPDGDINRTAHQGQLIVHALAGLRSKGVWNGEILRSLDLLYRNVRTEGIGAVDLFRLGRTAMSIPPENVRNFTIPVVVGMRGRASVVFVGPGAGPIFGDFADDGVLQAH
jgi:polyisoprenyl-teichoic acid--peptidoglycan teichoic acid transferase